MSEFIFRKIAEDKLEFVGDFDNLYKSESDPWGQSGTPNNKMSQYYVFSRTQLVGSINRRIKVVRRGSYPRGLEIGCGHGHVIDVLATFTGMTWEGVDVSEVAIDQAIKNYPGYSFFTGNITERFSTTLPYNIVVLGQILWYILHKIPVVWENCYNLLADDGLLIISQAFLTEPQKYGVEVVNGFDGMLKLLTKLEKFKVIEARYEDRLGLAHNDGLFVLRKI